MTLAFEAPQRELTSVVPALADPRRHDQKIRLTRLLAEAAPECREQILTLLPPQVDCR